MVSSDVPSELERGEILAFDRGLVLRESFGADFPLRDLHQIRTIEGRLYATCSFDNAIAIRHEDGRWSQWLPLGRPACAPWDHNHFNTVEYVAGNICLVAHNHGASEVLLFDAGTHELRQRIPLGVQAHNLWKSGDEWNVCSSAEGRLAGTRGFARETGGFPRGIFIGADFAIVGISELAERAARDFTNGELVVYDADWRECDRIVFSNEGLVLDIAELPPQEGAKP